MLVWSNKCVSAHEMDPAFANARMNTEYYYAVSLIGLLKRIHEKMFVFTAPSILGRLSQATCEALGEATRAFLYGLNRSAVALSRTTLEAALKERIDLADLAKYRSLLAKVRKKPKGELQALIDLAGQKRLFTNQARRQAHNIRILGNETLHPTRGRDPTDDEAWRTLKDVRFVIEELADAN
ncbi:MAG: DUF4145 domain-containing protein [Phycisphaerales bacterium]|nr:DUF4145 domain-containing protein [Phycisphaerales bacterium]